MSRYLIKAAGRTYIGLFASAALAIIDAQERFGVHNASARRLP